MDTPCDRCPQHSSYRKDADILHLCKENWYARVSTARAAPTDPDESLTPLNRTELNEFWNMWPHWLFSCPYRREKLVYKVIPLVFSLTALLISLANSETIKGWLGFGSNAAKPTQLAQPILVRIDSSSTPTPTPIASPRSAPGKASFIAPRSRSAN
jgi:hypothetical protein